MAKKSGLGKGLDALFLDNETAESSSLMTLRVSDIEPNKDQPRKAFEPNALAELADPSGSMVFCSRWWCARCPAGCIRSSRGSGAGGPAGWPD